MEQNREPRNEPTLTGTINLQQGGKNIQWGKDSLFDEWCWENWTATCKRIELHYSLTPCTEINSKWIKTLSVKSETIKVNLGSMLFDISLSNIFLDMSPQARKTKAKINKWD